MRQCSCGHGVLAESEELLPVLICYWIMPVFSHILL